MNQSANRHSPLQLALISGLISSTAIFSFLGLAWCRSVKATLQDSPKAIVDQVWQLVNREYVDGKFNQNDWLAVRRELLSKDYSSKEEAYNAIRNALKLLNDPYSRFLDPKQYQALTSQTAGEVSGIGIRMEINERTKRLTIVEAIENSPALKAGIQSGDEILAIDGKPTATMKIDDASGLIRGRVGSAVVLRIGRQGQGEFDVKLTRATIEVPAVKYTMRQEGTRKIGYIRLGEFSAHASEQMRRAIRDLNSKGAQGYVLDLRGNPGGLLQASIEIARMWLDDGSIVRTVDRKGGNDITKANRTALAKQPLAVLVDSNSASASEILTGALQDNQRAVVIGTTTFGKALVQSVHELADGSGVAITIAHYYTPKGTDINQKGITPDIKLDLSESQQKQLASNPDLLGTLNDPHYVRALSVLSSNHLAKPGSPQWRSQFRSLNTNNL